MSVTLERMLALLSVAACGESGGNGADALLASDLACVATVGAGGTACAARLDGAVYCWGGGSQGELGDGTFGYPYGGSPPTRALIERVVQIGAGEYTTCALRDDGTGACWGDGSLGQIGDGATTDRPTPRDLPFGGIAELVAGAFHACARLTDGSGYCWGDNTVGTLGVPTSGVQPTPIAAPVGDAIQLAISDESMCALRPDHHLECWGYNFQGQLGDGTTTTRSTPAAVQLADPIDRIAGGCHKHFCAVSSLGEVWCWGSNELGQLGRGTLTPREPVPARVVGLTDAAEVVVGVFHSCALKRDGTAWCWGSNEDAALGDGGFDSSATPVQVVSLGGRITELAASCGSTYALREDHVLLGWGARGSLGTSDTLNQPVPQPIPIPCQ